VHRFGTVGGREDRTPNPTSSSQYHALPEDPLKQRSAGIVPFDTVRDFRATDLGEARLGERVEGSKTGCAAEP
jgi:hypothetical protein